MADYAAVADQFVTFYYNTFDNSRQELANLYQDKSMMSFENDSFLGSESIVKKLLSLPFQKVQHRVDTKDFQPSNESGGILVTVTGALLVDEEQRPMSYSQTFQLAPNGAGGYFIYNDIFRLVYPGH